MEEAKAAKRVNDAAKEGDYSHKAEGCVDVEPDIVDETTLVNAFNNAMMSNPVDLDDLSVGLSTSRPLATDPGGEQPEGPGFPTEPTGPVPEPPTVLKEVTYQLGGNESPEFFKEITMAVMGALFNSEDSRMGDCPCDFTGRDGRTYSGSRTPDGRVTVSRSADTYGVDAAQGALRNLGKRLRIVKGNIEGTSNALEAQTRLGAPQEVLDGFQRSLDLCNAELTEIEAEVEKVHRAQPSVLKESLGFQAVSLREKAQAKREDVARRQSQYDARLVECESKTWQDFTTGTLRSGPDDKDQTYLDSVQVQIAALTREAETLERTAFDKQSEADLLPGLEPSQVWEFLPGDCVSFTI